MKRQSFAYPAFIFGIAYAIGGMRFFYGALFTFILMTAHGNSSQVWASEPKCPDYLKGRTSIYLSQRLREAHRLEDGYFESLAGVLNKEILGPINAYIGTLEDVYELLNGARVNRRGRQDALELIEEVVGKYLVMYANAQTEVINVLNSLDQNAEGVDSTLLCILDIRCQTIEGGPGFSLDLPNFHVVNFDLNDSDVESPSPKYGAHMAPDVAPGTVVLATHNLNAVEFLINVFSIATENLAMKRLKAWVYANLKMFEETGTSDSLFQKYTRRASDGSIAVHDGLVRAYLKAMAADVQDQFFQPSINQLDRIRMSRAARTRAMRNLDTYPSTRALVLNEALDESNIFEAVRRWTEIMQNTISKYYRKSDGRI